MFCPPESRWTEHGTDQTGLLLQFLFHGDLLIRILFMEKSRVPRKIVMAISASSRQLLLSFVPQPWSSCCWWFSGLSCPLLPSLLELCTWMTVHWRNTFQFTWWLLVRYRCCIVVVDAVAIENRKMRVIHWQGEGQRFPILRTLCDCMVYCWKRVGLLFLWRPEHRPRLRELLSSDRL